MIAVLQMMIAENKNVESMTTEKRRNPNVVKTLIRFRLCSSSLSIAGGRRGEIQVEHLRCCSAFIRSRRSGKATSSSDAVVILLQHGRLKLGGEMVAPYGLYDLLRTQKAFDEMSTIEMYLPVKYISLYPMLLAPKCPKSRVDYSSFETNSSWPMIVRDAPHVSEQLSCAPQVCAPQGFTLAWSFS
jgi:hypothetical protein